MKTSIAALAAAAVLFTANFASAQIGFGGFYVPQPIVNSPFGGGFVPTYPPTPVFTPPNPVVHNSTQGQLQFDPNTGQWIQRTDQKVILNSALDPNRHVVDPGSLRVSSAMQTIQGVTFRVITRRWTSFGKPHFDTKRERIHNNGLGGTTVSGQSVQGF